MNMMPKIAAAGMPGAASIATRALVVSLTIRQWEGRRLDRKVTREVNQQHNAADDASRVNKLLVPADSLKSIGAVVSETRAEFLKRTLPWLDSGGRIMAADAYMAHTSWMRGQESKFRQKVDDFLAAYPRLVSAAASRLGSMFDHTDYPDTSQLRGKFAMELTVLPVPTADDFRVAMSDAQAARIRSEIEATVADATAAAVRDVYERVADKVGRMVERLNAYRPAKGKGDKVEGVFRDSLVENIRDLIGILPSLNITGDPELTAMADRLRPLAQYDAETLRISEPKRRDVAAEAQKVLDHIGGFLA